MQNNDDAKLKILKVKVKLLQEIRSSERYVHYTITHAAESLLTDLHKKLNGCRPETIELSKEEYGKIESFLWRLKTGDMHLYDGNSSLKSHYESIHTKQDILNQL